MTNYILADPRGLTFVGCGIEYFNVTAYYNPIHDAYELVDATPSSQYFTSVLLEPLISQLANQRLMADAQSAILLGDRVTFQALLSQDLGRMAVAWPSSMFNTAPAHAVSHVDVQALGA